MHSISTDATAASSATDAPASFMFLATRHRKALHRFLRAVEHTQEELDQEEIERAGGGASQVLKLKSGQPLEPLARDPVVELPLMKLRQDGGNLQMFPHWRERRVGVFRDGEDSL